MRVAIREQLTTLIVLLVLVALAVVAVPTWIYVHRFVTTVTQNGLALTASLKAARISSDLELLQQSCVTMSSRILLQNTLEEFYNADGVRDPQAWARAADDIGSALAVNSLTGLLQARIYSRNTTGGNSPLLNVTSTRIENIRLPYDNPDGTPAILSNNADTGYPAGLYPNLTYIDLQRPNTYRPNTQAFAAEPFPGIWLSDSSGVLLGPLIVNSTFALVSLSIPIRDNGDGNFILGYMTVVGRASSLFQIRDLPEGHGDTGITLVVGPDFPYNRFDTANPASNQTYTADRNALGNVQVRFVLPPETPEGVADRHDQRNIDDDADASLAFAAREYPAVLDSFAGRYDSVNNASSMINTVNEQGIKVAVGFARTSTPIVNWTVIVEQEKQEAYHPITTLRNILLGTVFGTVAFILILVFPCAHMSVLPIRRLREATAKTVQPPGYDESFYNDDNDSLNDEIAPRSASTSHRSSEKGMFGGIKKYIRRRRRGRAGSDHGREQTRRIFKIPGKVEDRKHFISDELTDLTTTFNDMSDELVRQVTSLDEKVADRTHELEISKKAAEAANESKTLFIANLSHELKTPLNGILGMCAVCMEDDDIVRIKQSLKTVYKSGDLLLHLLEDLLSFSKNQIGQQLNLEEKEFRLADIRSQILIIFDKQVREGNIKFDVNFIATDTFDIDWNNSLEQNDPATAAGTGTADAVGGGAGAAATTMEGFNLPAMGPNGTGRLKDMCLWGDQHRVLQVLINLVSNSLKFTPAGGKVSVRIKCLGEMEQERPGIDGHSRTSSTKSSNRIGRSRHRMGSTHSANSKATSSNASQFKHGTALSINPMDPKATPHVNVRERTPSPAPANARALLFEFEVEDTGPGIAEHMQQRVFEPFVQGDLGLSKKFGGTGLGLSICHQLATLMGGSITLASTVGVGTTFTMRIPLKYVRDKPSSTASSSLNSRPGSVEIGSDTEIQRSPVKKANGTANASGGSSNNNGGSNSNNNNNNGNKQQKDRAVLEDKPRLIGLSQPFFATSPASNRPQSTEEKMASLESARAKKEEPGKLHVLVADDNSTNIEVVSRMLKLEEVYDVTIAKDGQQAYELVKATMEIGRRFDVIFMDIQMPILDGLQSTRMIRKMGYTSPIVALTAFSEDSNVKECMESGMDEFLSKPIRRPALKQVLKKFATIPEEPETLSQTRRTTPEASPKMAPVAPDTNKNKQNNNGNANNSSGGAA